MKSPISLKLIKNVKRYTIIIYCLELLVRLIHFQDKYWKSGMQCVFYKMLSKTHSNVVVISAVRCLQQSYSTSDYTLEPLKKQAVPDVLLKNRTKCSPLVCCYLTSFSTSFLIFFFSCHLQKNMSLNLLDPAIAIFRAVRGIRSGDEVVL